MHRDTISACCNEAAPGSTLVLTYVDRHGRETHKKLPLRRGEAHAIETRPIGGASLRRMRVFSREAALVYDESFSHNHDWRAEHRIAVRPSTPLPGMHPHEVNPFRRKLIRRGAASIEERAGAHLPKIHGLANGGKPGQPSLPVEIHRILIPPCVQVTGVRAIEAAAPVRMAAPRPVLVPPAVKDTPNIRSRRSRQVDSASVAQLTGRFPREMVRLERIETFGWGAIATVQLWPVQYDFERREFIHHHDLAFELVTDLLEPPGPILFPDVRGRSQAATLLAFLNNPALNYSVLDVTGLARAAVKPQFTTSLFDPILMFDPMIFVSTEPCPFVIITDDVTWKSTSSPNPPFLSAPANLGPGDAVTTDTDNFGPIGHFERLACWKTSRGRRTKVIPVGFIVDAYNAGELAKYLPPDGAIDVPEMIRAFILYANDAWKTGYVLLGGDINIVPTRRLVAVSAPNFAVGNAVIGPGANALGMPQAMPSYLAKLSASSSAVGDLDENNFPVDRSWGLVALSSGTVYRNWIDNPALNGWYFAKPGFPEDSAPLGNPPPTDASEAAKVPLNVVVYGGPELQAETIGFAWLWPGVTTETDHYYSDMTRAPSGQHDFDANGNLVLGQFVPAGVDNIQSQGSVCVGRAPVTSGQDARNFVDKVISYETMQAKETKFNSSYLSNLALMANNWVYPWETTQYDLKTLEGSTGLRLPVPGYFWWDGENPADVVMWAEADPGHPNDSDEANVGVALSKQSLTGPTYSLYAVWSASGQPQQLIPYDATGQTSTCWYFCSDATFRYPATDQATPFVRVKNSPACDNFFWQSPTEDYASMQKERIFEVFQKYFTAFANQQRYYADSPNAAFAGQNVQQLLPSTFGDVMGSRAHFISASGHGNYYYVSGYADLLVSTASPINNANMPFIMFAHSCLTADPGAASLGQFLVNQPNGAGAVGYVGFSHSCLTGDETAAYEQGFWTSLYGTGDLGTAVAAHINATGMQDFSQLFLMMLYGDPEMPVWRYPPPAMSLSVSFQSGTSEIAVTATDATSGQPIFALDVTVLQGWTDSRTDPQTFHTTSTDDNGLAIIALDPASEARIVVSASGRFVPQMFFFDPAIGDVLAGGSPFSPA